VNRDQGGPGGTFVRKGPVGKAKKKVENSEKGKQASETENVPERGVAARPKAVSGKGGRRVTASVIFTAHFWVTCCRGRCSE